MKQGGKGNWGPSNCTFGGLGGGYGMGPRMMHRGMMEPGGEGGWDPGNCPYGGSGGGYGMGPGYGRGPGMMGTSRSDRDNSRQFYKGQGSQAE